MDFGVVPQKKMFEFLKYAPPPLNRINSELQVDKLDGVWPLEKHGLLEGTALAETIPFIKAMDGDFTE